jgi:hypothetical protein
VISNVEVLSAILKCQWLLVVSDVYGVMIVDVLVDLWHLCSVAFCFCLVPGAIGKRTMRWDMTVPEIGEDGW